MQILKSALVTTFLLCAYPLHAATITMGFEGIPNNTANSGVTVITPYTEQGMTMTPVGHYDAYNQDPRFPGYTELKSVVIHQGNNGSGVDFTLGGSAFDLLSLDITGWLFPENPNPATSTLTFTSSAGGSHEIDQNFVGTIDFTALTGFSNITSLSLRTPNPGVTCSTAAANCPNVGFDQLVFRSPSAVPLPAAVWLFFSALGALFVAKRKQLNT